MQLHTLTFLMTWPRSGHPVYQVLPPMFLAFLLDVATWTRQQSMAVLLALLAQTRSLGLSRALLRKLELKEMLAEMLAEMLFVEQEPIVSSRPWRVFGGSSQCLLPIYCVHV